MTQVLLVRHAIAEDRAAWAETAAPDEARPLTLEGRKKMKTVAQGLRRTLPELELIATSPLVRALQTAEIVAQIYDSAQLIETDSLAPGAPPDALASWVAGRDIGGVIAAVGHEPDLGLWASWALADGHHSFVPMKKGGACLIEFPHEVDRARGRLRWLLAPRQLRQLAVG